MLADFNAGMVMDEIAAKYKVSKGSVSKLCSHKEAKNIDKVTKLVTIEQELMDCTDLEEKAIRDLANQKLRDIEFYRRASITIAKVTMSKVTEELVTMESLEKAQNIISKGRDTVVGKTEPQTAVQINNQVAYRWEDE